MNLYVPFIKPACVHYQTFTYPSLNYNKVVAIVFHLLAFLISSSPPLDCFEVDPRHVIYGWRSYALRTYELYPSCCCVVHYDLAQCVNVDPCFYINHQSLLPFFFPLVGFTCNYNFRK